ncbi:retrovirus-related pol polyprotein from transposon RE1 [Citrus sinensis]|nr:retrovirus-related pol polyprotein from transposon RE1 [Citrus sinensis]
MEDQTQTKTKDKEASGSGLGKTMMSPYFLSASDNPGTIITQVQLRGTNYDEWASAMRTALRAKKKFGFVDGTVKPPADDSADLEDWWMVNSMLVSWIQNTIEPNLRSTVTYTEVAKLLWDDIKERFSVGNGPRVQQLKSELANCKQRGAEWDKKRDEEKLHQFLMGLDEAVYGGVRSHILSTEPLPKLNRAYAIVIQEEQVQSMTRAKEERSEPVAFAVQAAQGSHDNRDKTSVLSTRNAGRGRGNSRQNGGNNGRGRGGPARANVAQVATGSNNPSGELTESAASGLSGLNSEQWNTLLNLLNSQKDSNSRISGKRNSMEWILDTGASHHMTGNRKILRDNVSVIPCSIRLPDGNVTIANTEGTVVLASHLRLNNVLFVPSLTCNLISVSQLIRDVNCFIQFYDQLCVIQDRITRMLIGAGEQREGLYYFRDIGSAAALSSVTNRACDLWHRRLGHPSSKVVQLLPFIDSASCLSSFQNCDVCFRAKQCHDKFVLSNNKASDIFELIHCDLWGPYRTTSSCGAHYFLTIVDDFSRGVWTYLLIAKNEVGRVLRNFLSMVSKQFHKLVKIIRTDNGTEFMHLSDFFAEHGIHHQTSCVGTSQQNGRVERKHRHILNVARALRFQAFLPIEFWGECVLTACYLINRTPSVLLDGQTPYERLFGKAPSYANIRSFGCLAYAYNRGHRGDKFASRSRRCIFMGYPFGKKGWYLYDLESASFFTSRDVTFVEHDFPYKALTEPTATVMPAPERDEPVLAEDLSHDLSAPVVSPDSQDTGDVLKTINTPSPVPASPTFDEHASDDRRGIEHLSPSSRPSSCSHAQSLPAAITAGVEPASFAEAVRDPKWREAMYSELQALENNGTWTVVSLPPGKRAIGCKWVYRIKYNADGTIERYKARLVILGNKQVEGIDYTETFAPVAKLVTVRTFLAVAAARNWELHQMDVHNAFLHGELNEEVYMRLPPGFTSNESGMVCRLRKSLYGLKQAPRCWFAKLAAALKTYGFAQSSSDYSLFTLHRDNIHLLVLVYVDDIIVSGNHSEAIRVFKMYLSDCFYMKDLGPLKYFLGIEVARNPTGIFLSQRKYVLDIISEAGLLGAKPAPFPLEPNHQLALAEGLYFSDPAKYRRLVGRLIYLSATRPELSYSVHLLSQFMQQPRERHWDAALRVVRYLKGNPGQGVFLSSDCDLQLYGWCDSDWASCPLSRRSLSGWFVMLGSSPISWKSKKQHTVARSSAEAYQAALHLAANPVFHERTKHIEVDCHFVRDEIQRSNIQPAYVSTHIQLADIFTKALGSKEFEFLLRKLGIRDLHAPT